MDHEAGIASQQPSSPGDPAGMYKSLEQRYGELNVMIEDLEGQLKRAVLERSMVFAAQEEFSRDEVPTTAVPSRY